MPMNVDQIKARAMEIIQENPAGIRWVEILRTISSESPETSPNTIKGSVYQLVSNSPDNITKVARGLYRLTQYVNEDEENAAIQETEVVETVVQPEAQGGETLTEKDFYQSFAEWLVDNDEATYASPLGGPGLGGKWGTPDVIGVLKPRAQDLFKFEAQIISAEIKAVSNQSITAFGQAVAYRLFSHISYIVLPKSISSDDLSRLKSLCSINSIGLVTFTLDRDNPEYKLIVIPSYTRPDVFYVNTMLERLRLTRIDIVNALIS